MVRRASRHQRGGRACRGRACVQACGAMHRSPGAGRDMLCKQAGMPASGELRQSARALACAHACPAARPGALPGGPSHGFPAASDCPQPGSERSACARARAAWYSVFLNSLVHVFMYAYYFAATALGANAAARRRYLWWGRYLTQFQARPGPPWPLPARRRASRARFAAAAHARHGRPGSRRPARPGQARRARARRLRRPGC